MGPSSFSLFRLAKGASRKISKDDEECPVSEGRVVFYPFSDLFPFFQGFKETYGGVMISSCAGAGPAGLAGSAEKKRILLYGHCVFSIAMAAMVFAAGKKRKRTVVSTARGDLCPLAQPLRPPPCSRATLSEATNWKEKSWTKLSHPREIKRDIPSCGEKRPWRRSRPGPMKF